MSEMRDDLRKSVTRFCYPVFTAMWFFIWLADRRNWLFFLFAAWTLYRTVVIWRKDRNEL